MQQFAQLGSLVEERWKAENYREDLFPAIAAGALAEANLIERVDPWEIIRWVHSSPNLPHQQDRKAKFGDPPITLFNAGRFYIDVYFWLDGTTSIHQHSFSGAFQVLLGSSVHSQYSFERKCEINPHFVLGQIALKHVALRVKGDIEEIRPGPTFIHSLFHLERPSVTITIRSKYSPQAAVQYSYLKPYVAYDPFYEDDSLAKKEQTVSLLLSMKHPEADQFVTELLDKADFQTAFAVLKTAFGFLGNNELEGLFGLSKSKNRFGTMLEHARRKHGNIVDQLPPVFEEEQRQQDIIRRRGMIAGEDHRFFLALLLNVPDRDGVLDLIKQKFPDGDPIELAAGWINELSKIRIFGSPEPNVLGIKDFNESYLYVVRGMLQGLTDAEINSKAATDGSIAGKQQSVVDVANQIRRSPLFKVIFS